MYAFDWGWVTDPGKPGYSGHSRSRPTRLGLMKRRQLRERDEAAAREQAERRTEGLLAQLKGQEAAARRRSEEATPATVAEPENPEPAQAADEPT